jgi:hypothetical protein
LLALQALVTEVAGSKPEKLQALPIGEDDLAPSSYGNGKGAYATSSNGNGNGNGADSINGNGASSSSAAAAAAAQQQPAVSNEAILGAAFAAAAATIPPATATATFSDSEDEMDPAAAGQLEMAAALADPAKPGKKGSKKGGKLTAAGTPYANPGGRWSQFKRYSTFQRTLQIWGFAIQFAFKYFLLGKKWTYGKAGMTPEAVSAKKSVLAVWLREGLVRLGPTFIKIGQQFSTRVDVLSKVRLMMMGGWGGGG